MGIDALDIDAAREMVEELVEEIKESEDKEVALV